MLRVFVVLTLCSSLAWAQDQTGAVLFRVRTPSASMVRLLEGSRRLWPQSEHAGTIEVLAKRGELIGCVTRTTPEALAARWSDATTPLEVFRGPSHVATVTLKEPGEQPLRLEVLERAMASIATVVGVDRVILTDALPTTEVALTPEFFQRGGDAAALLEGLQGAASASRDDVLSLVVPLGDRSIRLREVAELRSGAPLMAGRVIVWGANKEYVDEAVTMLAKSGPWHLTAEGGEAASPRLPGWPHGSLELLEGLPLPPTRPRLLVETRDASSMDTVRAILSHASLTVWPPMEPRHRLPADHPVLKKADATTRAALRDLLETGRCVVGAKRELSVVTEDAIVARVGRDVAITVEVAPAARWLRNDRETLAVFGIEAAGLRTLLEPFDAAKVVVLPQ